MPRPDAAQKIAAAAPRTGPSRTLVAVVVAAIAVLAVVGAVLAAQLGKSDGPAPTATSSGGSTAAATTGPRGSFGFGQAMVVNPGAPATAPVLDVFEDPQCPVCKHFEAAVGPTIDALVKANEVKLVVHTMTFLDVNLRNDSSTRAANGGYCAADQGSFRAYMEALYAAQPAQEGKGWTDEQLRAVATSAGVPDIAAWQSCQGARTYKEHARLVNENALKSGVHGTPTVQVNGTEIPFESLTADGVRAAVKAATK